MLPSALNSTVHHMLCIAYYDTVLIQFCTLSFTVTALQRSGSMTDLLP